MIAEFDADHPQGEVVKPTTETNGSQLPDLKIVSRVGSIPVVQDGLATFDSVVNSTQLTAGIYNAAYGVAAKSLNIASPLIAKGQPLIEKADALANQGLDLAESKFPYPFKTSTKEMTDQSYALVKGTYDDRVSPLLNNEIIKRAIEQIDAINKALASSVVAVKDTVVGSAHSASEQAHALTAQMVDQLYQLQSHGKALPPMILDSVSKSYADVRAILAEKDKTTQQKATEIAHYVQGIVQPELEKAQEFLFKAQNKAEKEASDVASSAESTVNSATSSS